MDTSQTEASASRTSQRELLAQVQVDGDAAAGLVRQDWWLLATAGVLIWIPLLVWAA